MSGAPSTGMLRTQAVAAVAAARGRCLSISTMQATAAWVACGQADERNVNLLGSMGSASAIGLGLAVARPEEQVMVLDGDGSLLMQLGSLVSIADRQPRNLYHLVFENGVYETSGAQPVPGAGRADLCAMARAAGYAQVARYRTPAEITAGLPSVLAAPGPALVSLVISGQGEVDRSAAPDLPDFGTQLANLRSSLTGSAA